MGSERSTRAVGLATSHGGLSLSSLAKGRALSGVSRAKPFSGWLFIRYLWVSDSLRGRGIGRELMAGAEAHALERGCHSAWVDTFSFQAPGFYPKLGYEVFGELDYPPGHKRIFLRKRLVGA
jgi:GNAT superfamily N-acetyltransferase